VSAGRVDVAPDVAVRLVAGGLTGVVDTFLFGQLAQEGMPQHVRRDFDVLLLRAVGIGLAGDALDDLGPLAALVIPTSDAE